MVALRLHRGTRAFPWLQRVGGCFLAAEHGFQDHGLQQLHHVGSAVVAHVLSRSAAWRIFPDQGLNPCLLHWAGGFLSTGPPGKSSMDFLIDNRYDCLPLAPRIYVHPPRLTPFQLSRVTGRLLLFPDSLLNQTW